MRIEFKPINKIDECKVVYLLRLEIACTEGWREVVASLESALFGSNDSRDSPTALVGRQPIKRKRILQIAAGVVVTIVCFVIAFWGVDLGMVTSSFARANYASLPLLLVLLTLFFWLKAIRWRMLLTPAREFRTMEVVPAMMIGFMGNNLLPAHLGEFIRVFVLGRQYRISKTTVFSSVVLERVFDVIAILLVFGISMLLVKGLPEDYKTASLYLGGLTIAAIFILVAYLVWTERFVRVISWFLSRIPLLSEGIRDRVLGMLESGAVGLAALKNVKLVAGIVITSFLQWGIMGGMVYVSLVSFGIYISPLASFVVVGVTAIGVTVPSSPGFFGVIQACFRVSLVLFGVDEADAVAASVYYHLAYYIPVTVVGLWYVNRLGLRLGKIEEEAQADEAGNNEEETGEAAAS